MPLYEYSCTACGEAFELLVRKDTVPACPACTSTSVERLSSLTTVKSSTTRDKAMRAAKKRDATQAADRMHDQLKYEESHDRHG
ncbi:MAG: FmdB family zinc ribbon protein [Longimicrobiales bacterium]